MKFLDKNGVKVDAVCVDIEYINNDMFFLNERVKVTSIEDICRDYDTFNVLIGFSDYRKAKTGLRSIRGIVEVFFIDTPDRLDFLITNILLTI